MSITDANFEIPIIVAEAILKALTESANKPFVVLGIDKSELIKGEYVVKLNSSERMSIEADLREFLASLIAIELGIPTPHPAIIEVRKEFVETRKGFDDYLRFKRSIGVNFGNKFLGENVIQFMPRYAESFKNFIKVLQEIFIFDIFIENSDRSYEKPNLLIKDDEIFVIDHEIAFGFLHILPMFRNAQPWHLDNTLFEIIRIHCLFANLKGRHFLAQDFFENFHKLNSKFWDTAYKLLPLAWRIDDFEKIRDYLQLKVDHINEFKNEIMEILK